jgi:hypothetical protein
MTPTESQSRNDVEVEVEVDDGITDGRITAGITFALVGHLLTLLPIAVFAIDYPDRRPVVEHYLAIGGQVLLATICLGRGGWRLIRGDDGTGRGLLAGWVMGAVLVPVGYVVIGFFGYVAHEFGP